MAKNQKNVRKKTENRAEKSDRGKKQNIKKLRKIAENR